MDGGVRSRWRNLLDVSTSLALLSASAFVVYSWNAPKEALEFSPTATRTPIPDGPIVAEGAAEVGLADAPWVLVAFSDFECPFCGRFARDVFPHIKEAMIDSGSLRFVFRHFPLDIHANARRAAMVSECAAQRGAFWRFHDVMFQAPDSTPTPALIALAARASGLGSSEIETCIEPGGRDKQADVDRAAGLTLGVRSTPTFMLGRTLGSGQAKIVSVLSGTKPWPEFRQFLELGMSSK